jgi:hypothetical protein
MVATRQGTTHLVEPSGSDDVDSKQHGDPKTELRMEIDETSPRGLDQHMHQSSDFTPCGGFLLESANVASYGQEKHQQIEMRATTSNEMHNNWDTVMTCETLNENLIGKEENDLVPKDVYDVLRRLQHKTERKRVTRPNPICSATRQDPEHDGATKTTEEMCMRETHIASNEHPVEVGVIIGRGVTHEQNPHKVKSHQDLTLQLIHPSDISLEDSPFQIALRKRGFLDQYVFREEQHLSCIPIHDARHVEVPLGTKCGDDRYWLIPGLKKFEFSLSDTLESNQLLWEAASRCFKSPPNTTHRHCRVSISTPYRALSLSKQSCADDGVGK